MQQKQDDDQSDDDGLFDQGIFQRGHRLLNDFGPVVVRHKLDGCNFAGGQQNL